MHRIRLSTPALILLIGFNLACEKKQDAKDTLAKATTSATSNAHEGIDIEDPASCAPCHAAVAREWQESMHSRSHHIRDPIYGNMRDLRMKKQGEAVANGCANCHTPRAQAGDHDSAIALAGVSCASCHNISGVKLEEGKVGAQTLTRAGDDTMRGARDIAPGASPAHGTGEALAPVSDGETLCLSCHGKLTTPAGAVACSTGPEHAEGGSEQTCVGCHMPEVSGAAGAVGRQEKHRSHAFLGPHRAWYQEDAGLLEEAVSMEAKLDEDAIEVTLANQSAHGFPSGFPGRYAVLKVSALDKDGEVIWENFKENPVKEHRDAFFGKVYHDADGNPVPAAFAKTLAIDTRLKPAETRSISIDLSDVPEAASYHVALVYGLLPGKLAKKLGLSEAPEAKPKVIAKKILSP